MDSDLPAPAAKRRRLLSAYASDPSATAAVAAAAAAAADDLSAAPATPLVSLPSLPPPDHHLRIYAWNINGIQPFIQPSIGSYMKKLPSVANRRDTPITTSLRNFLRRHHWPQVLHLQEVKINPSDQSTQNAVRNAVNLCRSGPDDGPEYIVHFCLPRDKYNANGFGKKVYGVASVIRRDFFENDVSGVREVDWDREGRVLIIETHSQLSLWNIYAVNGTANPYKDPDTGKVAGSRHDRKLAFHAAMLDECRRLERDGWRLLLAGDFNVASQPIDGYPRLRTKPEQHMRNRDDFNRKFLDGDDGLRAIDTFRHLYPKRKRYSWLPRNQEWKSSCDRVDYILMSRSLLGPELVDADVLMTETDRGPSDHVPVYVQLDIFPPADDLVDAA